MRCRTLSTKTRHWHLCAALLSLSVSVAVIAQVPIVPPGPPTNLFTSAGNEQAVITFDPPAANGGSAITGYIATCRVPAGPPSPRPGLPPYDVKATAASSPVIVTGLPPRGPIACSVQAANVAGLGISSVQVSVTPFSSPIVWVSLFSSNNLVGYGAAVDLTLTVTGNVPTGTVAFNVSSTTADSGKTLLPGCSAIALAGGVATCHIPGSLHQQSQRIYFATYSGDASNETSSASFTQFVASNSAVLTVSANPLPPITIDRTATLTALVKMNKPVGTVTFFDNGKPVVGCTQTPLVMLPDTTDSAIADCRVTAPASPGGMKQYVVSYFYPTGHNSARTFEQTRFDLRVVSQGPLDYTDMWWAGASESGWGMSVSQHGSIQFNVIFAYDNLGKPLWYVMPGGSFNAAGTVFTGSLYLPASSPFSAYDASKFAIGAPVGSATITYTGTGNATLAYTINGVAATKSMQRQIFAAETTGPNLRTNDLWWATSAENGWGLNIAQQGRVLFPVWYTYDAAGKPTFFTAQSGSWNGTVWSGTVYSHTASAWLGVPFNASLSKATSVGTISLDFSDASNATMTYTVNGVTQVKRIERQVF